MNLSANPFNSIFWIVSMALSSISSSKAFLKSFPLRARASEKSISFPLHLIFVVTLPKTEQIQISKVVPSAASFASLNRHSSAKSLVLMISFSDTFFLGSSAPRNSRASIIPFSDSSKRFGICCVPFVDCDLMIYKDRIQYDCNTLYE